MDKSVNVTESPTWILSPAARIVTMVSSVHKKTALDLRDSLTRDYEGQGLVIRNPLAARIGFADQLCRWVL
jgi:hypothetical protein